jgi:preprotein translocase subunit YajC
VSPEARNQLLFIAVVVLLLFVLVIRPARKRAQRVSKLQAALSAGDTVMLTSGIFGTVLGIDEEKARVEVTVADGVVLTVHRGAIAEIVRDVPADGDSGETLDTGDPGDPGDTVDSGDTADTVDGDSTTTTSSTSSTTTDTNATTGHDAGTRGAN